jgi:hypothetical protein
MKILLNSLTEQLNRNKPSAVQFQKMNEKLWGLIIVLKLWIILHSDNHFFFSVIG